MCEFTAVFSSTFKRGESDLTEERMVVIQCDSGHVNGDLIACARNRIYDLKAKADDQQITHVLFVIHLPHHMISSSFVGFQGDPWVSSHVDDLRPGADNEIKPHDVIGSTISELFLGTPDSSFLFHREIEEDVSAVEGMDVSGPSGEEVAASEEGAASEEMLSDDEEKDSATAPGHLQETQHQEEEEMETEGVLPSHPEESHEMVVDNMETEPSLSSDAPLDSSRAITEPQKPTDLSLDSESHLAEKEAPVVIPVAPCTNSPLYRRLHNCIYAAASKLKDFTTKRSTKRVEILVHLIPQETPNLQGKRVYIV